MPPAISFTAIVRIANENEKGASINMDDEMKELNKEQTPSASDERKQNIKGEQFTGGADDAPSPEDRSSNEDELACKKEEDSSLLTRVIHKFGGKKRVAIAAVAVVVAIFCLPMLFPQLFCTHKLWANATCTSPRTCKSCGKTEGEPLGHEWEEATCTTPKTCQRCGRTEGKSLGHQPGSWTKEVDYIDATSKEIQECERCGEVVDTRNEKEFTSFVGDGVFSISPKGFIERLNEEFSNLPNCSSMKASYELDDSGMGLELRIKNGSKIAGIGGFFSDSSSQLLFSYLESENCFKNIVMYFESSDYAAATAVATIQAIDPSLSFSDAKEVGAACVDAPTVKNGVTYAIVASSGEYWLSARIE